MLLFIFFVAQTYSFVLPFKLFQHQSDDYKLIDQPNYDFQLGDALPVILFDND
jgi:hypothetical protein